MFKYVALFAALVACVAAAGDDAHAEVKEYSSDVRADGFNYVLDTTNDIHQSAAGDEHGNIHGSYEYVSPEGEHIKVEYVADEHGFQPSSNVLPTPHPIPEYVLRAIAYNQAHPQKEESHH